VVFFFKFPLQERRGEGAGFRTGVVNVSRISAFLKRKDWFFKKEM
jgi:hypothetical protein